MEAIIYTSNAGTSRQYAEMLGQVLGLRVYALSDKSPIEPKAEIIYVGWLMGGIIKGYKKASSRYAVKAVCAVGLAKSGSQDEYVAKTNKIPSDIPVFSLQGGFDITKLSGVYKLMMNIMVRTAGKALSEKQGKTPEEADMLDMLLNGGNRVSAENLQRVVAWYNESR